MMFWKKRGKEGKESPKGDELHKVNEALNKIRDGVKELAELKGVTYKKSWFRNFWRNSAGILAVITVLIAYFQYLEQSIESKIQTHEQMLLFAINNLESNSEVVRANGVKSLENIAFTKLRLNILLNKQGYIFIDKARAAFTDYAKSERKETKSVYNPVSTTILITGLDWIQKEINMFEKKMSDKDLWLFYKADLRQANCTNKDFSKLWFANVNFNSSILQACVFNDTYLEKANFCNSDLYNTKFIEAIVRSANFTNALLNFSDFEKAKGQYSIFVECNFSNARLDEANFSQGKFDAAVFNKASLKNTNFEGSSMVGCDFTNATLDGCNLDGCDLTGANFRNTDITKIKSLKGAILNNIIATDEQKKYINNLITIK